MKSAFVICVRLDSSRLPGKAAKEIAGKPAIRHILDRVCGRAIPVILSTTPDDLDTFKRLCAGYSNLTFSYGQPESPLHRLAAVVRGYALEYVIRITADDILIDFETAKDMLDDAKATGWGYVTAQGMLDAAAVEVIHRDNLLQAAEARKEPTEFVSYFVKNGVRRCGIHEPRPSLQRSYRLTMDYPEDAQVLDLVLRKVGSNATADEVIAYLDKHPQVLNINRQPFISFYTCAYKAEAWIGEAVNSVLRCGIEDMEYIVVDDASKDETAAKVAGFMPDKHLKLIVNQSNLGLASSSNVALKACRGKYVMRVDADDRLSPDFFKGFAQMVARAEAGAKVVFPAYATIDELGRMIEPWNDPEEHRHIGGALVDKRTLDEFRFRDGIRHFDGLELYSRLNAARVMTDHLDTVTWHYRQHGASLSHSAPKRRAEIKAGIMKAQGIPHS